MDFNLKYHEAFNLVLKGGYIQGENFEKNEFMTLQEDGHIVIVKLNWFNKPKFGGRPFLHEEYLNQNYRYLEGVSKESFVK